MPEDAPIELVGYHPSWPARFEVEREALLQAIGEWVVGGIHHVGSTAVPGLDAKPIIDILAGVQSLADSRACFEPLQQMHYCYAPHRAQEMHWFCKPDPARRTHHLHLVPVDSARFTAELAFRDHLRAHADAAEEYRELKRKLAADFKNDRGGYTQAKERFVVEIVRLARPPAREAT